MLKWIGNLFYYIFGWKLEGDVYNDVPKKLFVVIPHTSNFDFPVGLATKFKFGMDVGYVAKSSLFKWPFGWFFKMTGGIPVNRGKSHGFIKSLVRTIKERERFSSSIAPEGTRKNVSKLKSGFYHIAKLADIPIIYTKFDWSKKIVHMAPPRMVADTYEEELEFLHNHFKGVVGRVPEYGYGYDSNEKS